MDRWRRSTIILGVMVLLLTSWGRPEGRDAATAEEPDAQRRKMLEAAADYIQLGDWVTATTVLQKILMLPEDRRVRLTVRGPDGDAVETLVNAHDAAERMIQNLPEAGRQVYQQQYGRDAADMLAEATERNDIGQLRRAVRWYLHTEAGPDALRALARTFKDRADAPVAAKYYRDLLNRRDVAKWSPDDLYQASIAFRMTGDTEGAETTEKQLRTFVSGGEIRVRKRTLTAAALEKELERAADSVHWFMVGGDASRSAQGEGGPPFLERIWSRPLDNEGVGATARKVFADADRVLVRRQVVIPAIQPLTVTVKQNGDVKSWVICRTYGGLHAIDLTTGKLAWEAKSNWGLENMVSSSAKMATINGWLNYYVSQNQRPAILYENSRLGTLSTDGRFLFAVEDLAIPPPPTFQPPPGIAAGANPARNFGNKAIDDAVSASRLQAYDLVERGKLKWEIGGVAKDVPLAESFFLGPPLPNKGRLYVLVEAPSALPAAAHAVCPGPSAIDDILRPTEIRLASLEPKTGKVLSDRVLVKTRDKIDDDVGRRIAAAHLAAADGVLFVPTNAGIALGVDLKTEEVLWSLAYSEKVQTLSDSSPNRRPGWPPPPVNATAWKVSPPVIAGGKVVFAAPDSGHLHCRNLKDGSAGWKVKRADDDLYLAGVFGGKVLVVGKHYAKAYSLDQGELLWQLDTGVPSGFGAASDDIYYLPIRESVQSKEPEVCAIDLAKGQIVAHTKSRKQEIPGSLLFADDKVVSLTAREIVVYPQLKSRINEIDDLFAKNPNDPLGLTERAELKYDKGELQAATDDLRKALQNKPDKELAARARELLYATLTDYLQRDFAKAEKYLTDYEALGKIDKDGLAPDERTAAAVEERRRRAKYLLLVAKGREQQGRLREALALYLEFGERAGDGQLLSNPQDQGVKVDPSIWVRQRIDDMLKNAAPEKAKELREEIEKKWKELQGEKERG
jgi:outer membrane protein assembly factor BamB